MQLPMVATVVAVLTLENQNLSSRTDFLIPVLAAALAAAFTLIVTWLNAHRKSLEDQCQEYERAVREAADLASEYWLCPADNPGLRLMEARLVGFQHRLTLMSQIAFEPFSSLQKELLKTELADFFDACTGGEFGTTDRAVDTGRCAEAQAVAAQISLRVLKANKDSVRLTSYLARTLRLGS